MSENETISASASEPTPGESNTTATSATTLEANPEGDATPVAESVEEITYHAVEKDGQVTAIWEMQGRKHLRTIDPRSRQGQDILRLYTSEHHDEAGAKTA